MLAGRTNWIVGKTSSIVIEVVMDEFKFPAVSFAENLIMHGASVTVQPNTEGVVLTW